MNAKSGQKQANFNVEMCHIELSKMHGNGYNKKFIDLIVQV